MPRKAGWISSWVQTLGAILDEGLDDKGRLKVYVTVYCSHCKCQKEVDSAALAEKVGRDYSLVNRQCPCRFKEGCPGWNRFSYAYGRTTPLRPLRDEPTGFRWACGPRYSRGIPDFPKQP